MEVDIPEETHPVLEGIYFIFIALSLGLNLIAAVIALYAVIGGPGLALRGPGGSMVRCVLVYVRTAKRGQENFHMFVCE
ncbi:unnamed protein product [marine sediment metagenome]|uniref:Uncharacterized protein n=1 Tax=marine sediment metagenome TaxID=412755 RepID=X1I5W0_9ZZZZ